MRHEISVLDLVVKKLLMCIYCYFQTILRVTVNVNSAPLAKAGGVSEAGMKLLALPDPATGGDHDSLSAKQWAVVKYSDAMTRDVKVSEDVFTELREHFSDQEVVEITATVSSFPCLVVKREPLSRSGEYGRGDLQHRIKDIASVYLRDKMYFKVWSTNSWEKIILTCFLLGRSIQLC